MASNNKSVEKEAFLNQTTITAVSFGKDCKTVEESAFKNCSELSNINNDNKIENIGAYAFAHVSLINVSLPKAEIIGDNAFEGCSKLTNVTINNNCSFIGKCAFKDCEKLESVRIPNNNKFKTISENTFQNCAIPSITIPNNVTTIGNGAFNGCGKLSSVTFDLDSHVVNIGNLAFNECSSIKSISIPNTTTNIGYGAFRECKSLTSAIIGNSVTNIQGEAFNGCIGLTNINIPNSVTTIGSVAFARCSGLTTISIGDNVKNIGNDAFKGCNKIGSIYINNIASWCGINFGNEYANPLIYSTTSTYLYGKNEKLTDIDIPNSVSNIKSNVFYNYKNLNRIILASTVTSIGNNAFNGCENLKTVINLTSLPIIKGNEDNGHVAKYASRVIKGTSRINDFIFNKESNKNNELVYHLKSDVTDITLPSHTDGKYDISDSVFVEHTKLTKFTIPDNTVASIGERVFEGCEQLTDVSIGDGVTNIGNGTFKNCGITSMTIPNTVTNIGNEVFNGCSSLTELNINDNDDGSSDSEPPIIEIGVEPDTSNNNNPLNLGYNTYNNGKEGKGLFKDCPIENLHLGRNLTYDYSLNAGYSPFYGISSLKSVTIGNKVTNIGENAFYNCKNLSSIEIPNSVTHIGKNAFYECRGLTNVTIGNKVTNIGENAFYIYFATGNYKISSIYINNLNKWCNIDFENIFSNPLYHKCIDLYLDNIKVNNADINFPKNISIVKNYTFMHWGGLNSIKLPDNVISIGEKSFYGCYNLKSINVPNTLASVGADAFKGCDNIKVYIDGSTIPTGWCKINFENTDANPASISGGLYNIENKDNEESEPIENLIIPDDVDIIGSYAFYNFNKTKSIIIPDNVTDIGKGAFYGCGNIYEDGYNEIKRIVIGNNVTNIYQYNDNTDNRIETDAAFGKLGPVDFLIIGKKTPMIKRNHFNFDKSTPSIILINFSQYNYDSFNNSSTIKDNIYRPHAESFNDFMFDIYDIENKNTIKYNLCGYMGNGIDKLYLPSNYNGNTYEIGDYIFYNCNKLTSITIPNSVTKIGKNTFYNCNNITRIISNITTDTLFKVESSAFEGVDKNNCTLFVPIDGKEKYKETDGWKDFINIVEVDKCGDNLYYYIDDNDTLFIFGDGAMYDFDYDDYKYTWDNSVIKSIIIENGVTSIGDYAFYNCYNLTNIIIPDSVTSIGESSFEECVNIKTIDIPNNVTSIGDYAFYNCYELTNITIPNSVTNIGDDAFYDTSWYNNQNDDIIYAGKVLYKYKGSSIKNINIKNDTLGISANAFNGHTTLEYITIPNSVINIGADAFYDTSWYNNQNDGIVYAGKVLYKYKGEMPIDTPIEIKKETICIAPKAFEGCSGLTSVTIPNSVTTIGDYAFEGCETIEKIIIGKNVTNIGRYIFANCKDINTIINLSSLIIEKEHLRNENNEYTNMIVINAPNGSIEGDFIFEKNGRTNILCEYIGNATTLSLPANYKGENYVIKASLFLNNTIIESIEIPNSVTSIGSATFYECSNLNNVTIGNGVTRIGNYSFFNCYNINTLTIGNNVTLIGDKAFAYCHDLTSVTIPDGVTSIGESAFQDCSSLTSITIPDGVTSIGESVFSECSNLTSVTIGNGVTRIGNFSFYNCYNINTLTIGNSVTSIGDYAFYKCSGLKKIIIPDSVESIGNYAFGYCTNIEEIIIGKNVKSIGVQAFNECKGHKVINYSNLDIKINVFGHGNIGAYAAEVEKR